ncbi:MULTISPECIES: N-formylglutamate amidohydrolase [Brucella]|jgi:predicted N-formylglutamate amidohydrolase|uniref:N-formylglutamate amidohydrolase n=2 Tax=Brucella/Ochrobactrum group TaxID=2826938 RepID=A0A7V6PEM9_9HYPH|nr:MULTISPECIES: N-formylglutamate amidohydrolase [Brucella/Ochrobactrum group]PJR89878.1 N-formylglutamate amidohydrolase [Ochrobactrum sp. 721/2009]PJT14095.1 N-formylglutamate amidohydrolase [Ochrobactrum sp. 720/2009]PJT24264.1 N-formylglutamate amidohydrolase [Ochrobactrum sp. 715/2009]PJT30411.1 N-formylglutamate amidohydrolase [Ochrobactrum sp. 695/2009]PJT33938.1 N-formylglutamate amidohydrolase [Ochrobactrum sp. 689/2009]BBA72941.1 N-formylglutamate amidohydrolase [Ochrobactrum sp. P
MTDEREHRTASCEPVSVFNKEGESPYLLVCEHASNFIPETFDGLGLDADALRAHIAWDPGAVEVARRLASSLNAPLVESQLSRLLIDCNRPLDAHDLIPEISETTVVPGNHALNSMERMARIDLSHRPFHTAVEQIISRRAQRGLPSWIVTIHSFTPIYRDVPRPWQIGIIHDEDDRIGKPLIEALRKDDTLHVGVNEPYSPADRVYYTLERHARPRNAPCVMIELRNNEIADGSAQTAWAEKLATILEDIAKAIGPQDTEQGA